MNKFELTAKWPFFRKQTTVRDEVTGLIETFIDKEGTGFDGQEGLLLRNMLGLRDITAEDVMVPRADIVSVDITDGFESVIRQISEAAHSRVPAHTGNMDELLGMLHIKDLIAHALDPEPSALDTLVRPVLFVSPSIRLLDLLQEMRLKRLHLALVVDEFGGIDGLITIEDLVEEIVGEIEDEHDQSDAPHFDVEPDGSVVADARLELNTLEMLYKISFAGDERDELDTVGGLVITTAGYVPVRGEVIIHETGLEFEVLDSDPRRVNIVRISGLNAQRPEDQPAGADA
ncbi:CBS domain-containing protein [SAR116 cluster alpha proteobacterium HIMB100]|nr:CBS domain-containing protein [SAR116 cluster alpha proteobacterium HIMB100]